MKKRMTISIDNDIYDLLQEMPRKVSISEVVTWLIKAAFQDIKKGRELSDVELKEWLDSTPEGKDFRQRLIERWGPRIKELNEKIDKFESKMPLKKRAKK